MMHRLFFYKRPETTIEKVIAEHKHRKRSEHFRKVLEMIDKDLKLKHCPFCGGKADIEGISELHYISCENCYAETRVYGSKAEAIKAWNTRNYLGKQDSSNYSEFPKSSKGNQSVQVPEVVENGNCEYLPDECCEKSCKDENTTCKKNLQLSRSDIERMVKRKVFNTRNADTLKKMFIIAEINNSFKVYCGGLCIGESLTIEEAKGIVEVFLIDFICSALGVEE